MSPWFRSTCQVRLPFSYDASLLRSALFLPSQKIQILSSKPELETLKFQEEFADQACVRVWNSYVISFFFYFLFWFYFHFIAWMEVDKWNMFPPGPRLRLLTATRKEESELLGEKTIHLFKAAVYYLRVALRFSLPWAVAETGLGECLALDVKVGPRVHEKGNDETVKTWDRWSIRNKNIWEPLTADDGCTNPRLRRKSESKSSLRRGGAVERFREHLHRQQCRWQS